MTCFGLSLVSTSVPIHRCHSVDVSATVSERLVPPETLQHLQIGLKRGYCGKNPFSAYVVWKRRAGVSLRNRACVSGEFPELEFPLSNRQAGDLNHPKTADDVGKSGRRFVTCRRLGCLVDGQNLHHGK